MLIGKAERSIDAQGRLLIPPRFRRGLHAEESRTVCVSTWDAGDESHLRIYPEETFELLCEEQRKPGFEVDAGLLRIASSTESVEVDGNVRVRFDADALVEIGSAPKEKVLLIGAVTHVQVWNPERWAQVQSRLPGAGGVS
jgi:DNA-binding transcriptional regulator/RsmH inhibitor MraZ